jgi:dCMP deaminase
VFTTSRPCFGCTKELIQAHIEAVYFVHDWQHPDNELQQEYEKIQTAIKGGIRRLEIDDPDEGWAIPTKVPFPEDTGHTMPVDDPRERIPTQPPTTPEKT